MAQPPTYQDKAANLENIHQGSNDEAHGNPEGDAKFSNSQQQERGACKRA